MFLEVFLRTERVFEKAERIKRKKLDAICRFDNFHLALDGATSG